MNSVDSILLIAIVVFLPAFLYLILDYQGPKRILLQPDNVFGIKCLRTKDLIVQEFDNKGNLFASRGMVIYVQKKGNDKFIRIAHVPSGFSIFWLNNFKVIRRLTLKPECIETIVTGDGKIIALSAGYLWYGDVNGEKFKKTLKLSHYGIKIGRGILSNGLLKVNDNLLFFGEYFRNEERTNVRIFKSKNYGQTWDVACEFQSGTIRHIHALYVDPYTGKFWICTGDNDNESMIGWSDNDFKNIFSIGQGSQIWRTCHLVFTADAVYWGTDTGSDDLAGIYRWDKKSMELTQLLKTDGAVLFGTRLTNGTIIMSIDREGFPNEKDNRTRLFIISQGDKITVIPCGTWDRKKSGFRFGFAKLRFQRSQGNDSLIISCINQKEIPDGDLLIYSEEVLNQAFKKY